jgi:integral membrane protein (TIGR01906 family)
VIDLQHPLGQTIASTVAAAAVPILLISASILWVASDVAFIERGFRRYDVGRTTGLDADQLSRVAVAFVDYFGRPAGPMDVMVTIRGEQRPLFNAKEVRHMVDVQALMHFAARCRLVSAVLLAIACGLLLLGNGADRLARALFVGSGITLALMALAGLLSLVDFSSAFVKFHEIAFSNDDWMLDPRTDYLIMLFPEPFWLDAAIRVGLAALGGSAVVIGGGLALRWAGAQS